MARTLSSPRHGACAQRLQAMTKNIQLENLGLKLVAPETSRLLKQMYPSQLDSLRPKKSENATKGSKHQQYPHSVSGKDIIRLAVFRLSKPAFPEVGSAHVFFC